MNLSKRVTIELLTFLFAVLLGTLASLGLPACSSAPAPHTQATSAQLASVVVLVEQVPGWKEPALGDADFGERTGTYAFAWQGRCNAFALEREGSAKTGGIYLVTAAHCLRERALGSVVRYLPPDGFGIDRAVLVRVDAPRDYAELAPTRLGGLVALRKGPAPGPGEPVLSVSAFFEAQAQGTSKGELTSLPGGAWYGTTQHVQHGWSGSPVFARSSASGAGQWLVWGFLAKCETFQGKCADGAIAGAL